DHFVLLIDELGAFVFKVVIITGRAELIPGQSDFFDFVGHFARMLAPACVLRGVELRVQLRLDLCKLLRLATASVARTPLPFPRVATPSPTASFTPFAASPRILAFHVPRNFGFDG